MSQASLGGSGGYPSDWEPIYDTCHAAACTVCCHTESAFFCHSCDARSHVGDPTARQHQPVWVRTACENAPAAFTCQADAASLCISCDIEIHSANQLESRHNSVPIPPLSGIGFAASTNHLEKPHTENEIFSGNMCDDKLEEEINSWLLLDPDANNSHSNGLFTYGEKPDEYLDPIEHNLYAEYQRQDQNDLNQLSSSHQEEEGSDIVAPLQSFDENEQQQQQEQIYFNREHEAAKAALINNTSSSQWFCTPAPTPFMNAGYLLKATARDISSSYSRFSKETTNLFQKYPSLLMPLEFIATSREARVLRYREKRKARKFEKKIRYASKKAHADNKPRVKGRFVRKTDMEFEVDVDQMFWTEDYGNGIVPSSPSTTRE